MKRALLLSILASSYLLFAQENLLPERTAVSKTLANGFQYTLVENHKPKERAEIRLYVKAGSLDEANNQRGLAHFVEHMAFNGIKHFKKNELISYLESIGMVFGGDLNANTTQERTLYMLSLPLQDDNLKKALTIVRDWADGLDFDPQEYEKEKRIILEERRLRDTVEKRLSSKYFKLLYGNSLYVERDPIGLVEVIEDSNASIAKSFYDTWYRPESMHLVIVGDFNRTEVDKLVEQSMSSLKAKSQKKQVARVASDFNETQVMFVSDRELSRNSVTMFLTEDISPMRTVADKKMALHKAMILMLINLRMQEQLHTQSPKAMAMMMSMEQISRDRYTYEFAASYKSGDGLEAMEELYSLISSFEKYGFSAENFALSKRLILANVEKAHARLKDNQSADIANNLITTIENDSVYIDYEYDYNLTKELINSITLAELNSVYREILDIKNRSILFKDIDGKKLDRDEVLARLKDAKLKAKDLSKVEKMASSIIDQNLTTTKIISKSFNKDLGIYSYVLENNISVDFKQNSKNKNLLLLTAFSDGGYSILKGDKLTQSKNATVIIDKSAPGKWTITELEKIMTSKQASVDISIERFGEKIVASCNTVDIETMFELLYAKITEPKVDKLVLKNIKNILSNNIRQAENNPQYLFMKDIAKEYYYDNPELLPNTISEIEKLDSKSILALYKDRFADMNHFHFVISGDAEPAQIEQLIAKYLGNLPTDDRDETYLAIPYKYPKGDINITKQYNTQNRANLTIQYTSKTPFNIKNSIRTILTTNILSIRLRNLIREQKSGVYDISVNTEFEQELKDEAVTSIKFACDPKRRDELVSAIYSAIERLIQEGVSDDELQSVKRMIGLAYRKGIDNNSFWVNGIMKSYRFDTPVDTIVKFPDILDSIQRETLQDIAKELFGKNRLVMSLMPKKS